MWLPVPTSSPLPLRLITLRTSTDTAEAACLPSCSSLATRNLHMEQAEGQAQVGRGLGVQAEPRALTPDCGKLKYRKEPVL